MIELIILIVFAGSLFICIGLDISILYALLFGYVLFFCYGIYTRHTIREMLFFSLSGIKTIKNILITFLLIGIITALWRACGTIPYIVYYSTGFCTPQTMVLFTFLLCCLISYLTGTAFGTSATMGVICATLANSMGVPVLFTGGAVLSGSYFGDRCSPMSTSALLVSSLTHTDLFRNIRLMIKTSLFPFIISCFLYLLAGMSVDSLPVQNEMRELFMEHFVFHPVVLIPAAVIVLFSLFRINVRLTMTVSVLTSIVIAVSLQNFSISEVIRSAILGYRPTDPDISILLSGGGVISMLKVCMIVCISSCYSGMFDGTGLLKHIRAAIENISEKITPFGGIFLTSIITGMISCNQTLTIMLTHQLCSETEKNPEHMASHLENTAVVIPPLIPWSIASTVTLTAVNAPMLCILTGFYLYLLPIWNLFIAVIKKFSIRRTQ